MALDKININPIGYVQSSLKSISGAPMQGDEGAPDAWIGINEAYYNAMKDINADDEIILITWLHLSKRDILEVHPRDNKENPLTGVFSTRSADRPNPIGLHRVKVYEVSGLSIRVGPLEAIHGTPVIDIKPVI